MSVIPQGLRYFERVADKYNANDDSLIAKVYAEQKANNFDWFNKWESFTTLINKTNRELTNTTDTQTHLFDIFAEHWKTSLSRQAGSKLNFYSNVKKEYGPETYLRL